LIIGNPNVSATMQQPSSVVPLMRAAAWWPKRLHYLQSIAVGVSEEKIT